MLRFIAAFIVVAFVTGSAVAADSPESSNAVRVSAPAECKNAVSAAALLVIKWSVKHPKTVVKIVVRTNGLRKMLPWLAVPLIYDRLVPPSPQATNLLIIEMLMDAGLDPQEVDVIMRMLRDNRRNACRGTDAPRVS